MLSDSWQVDGRVSAKDFALSDIDNDGDLDIWVESTGGMNLTNHFLINNGSHLQLTKRIPMKDIQGEKAPTSKDTGQHTLTILMAMEAKT